MFIIILHSKTKAPKSLGNPIFCIYNLFISFIRILFEFKKKYDSKKLLTGTKPNEKDYFSHSNKGSHTISWY